MDGEYYSLKYKDIGITHTNTKYKDKGIQYKIKSFSAHCDSFLETWKVKIFF